MIMVVTHRQEIREHLNRFLQAKGHETCVPLHRQDVLAVMKDCHPHLIVLDLYLSEPSGVEVLRTLRQHGYHGRVVALSGESMMSALHEAHPIGMDKVVQVPAEIAGHFDFGQLDCAITMALRCDLHSEHKHHHARTAKRAYELYEARGRQDGHDVDDWLQAEQEVTS